MPDTNEYRKLTPGNMNEYGLNPFAVDLVLKSPLIKALGQDMPSVAFEVKSKGSTYRIKIERCEETL